MADEFNRRFPRLRKGSFLLYDCRLREEPGASYSRYSQLPQGLDLILVKLGGSVVRQDDASATNTVLLNLKLQIKALMENGHSVAVITSGATKYADGGPLKEGQRKLMEMHRSGPDLYGIEELLFDSRQLEDNEYAKQFAERVLASAGKGVVPYINSTPDSFIERQLDNSTAAAHLATAMVQLGRRPLAVMLGKFPGIYQGEEFKGQGPGKHIIRVILNPKGLDKQVVPEEKDASQSGFGGMGATINAAIQLQNVGVETIVANGMAYNGDSIVQEHRPLDAILQGRYVGTRFMPRQMWRQLTIDGKAQ